MVSIKNHDMSARGSAAPADVLKAAALVFLAALTVLAWPAPAVAAPGDGLSARRSVGAVVDFGLATYGAGDFGRGPRYGAGLFFRTGRHAAIEVLVERFSVPVAEGAASTEIRPGLAVGRLTATTVLVDHHWRLFSHGRVLPYALIGVGFAFLGYAPDDETLAGRRDFVDRLALQLGGGLEWRLSPRLAACVKARYHLVKTWLEDLPRTAPIRDTDPLAQDMLNLYALELSLGIKLAF
ncbi:MAG: porin family protein [Acidobacteria bacterium]|nr:porin family protein [Acidobacteriota bacterium]